MREAGFVKREASGRAAGRRVQTLKHLGRGQRRGAAPVVRTCHFKLHA